MPAGWAGRHVLLHFGAVDWLAVVSLNGQPLGEHRGGYLLFLSDMTTLLTEGANELVVQVQDPTDTSSQARGKQTLKPGGILYTAVSGIWQTVWLEPMSECHVESVTTTPDVEAGTASVLVVTKDPTRIDVTVCDGDRVVVESAGFSGTPVFLKIPETHLWSPHDPHVSMTWTWQFPAETKSRLILARVPLVWRVTRRGDSG